MRILNKLGLGLLATAFVVLLSLPTAEARICNVGDPANVLWHGTWYPATVLKTKKNQCYIHYTGYNDSWNEWVGANRIRVLSSGVAIADPGGFGAGSAVMVLWHGKWYPAHVLSTKGNKLYIHYDGYGSNWDEWVGPGRYKLP